MRHRSRPIYGNPFLILYGSRQKRASRRSYRPLAHLRLLNQADGPGRYPHPYQVAGMQNPLDSISEWSMSRRRGQKTSHLRQRTNVEWDSEDEMTEVVNHPRLASSRALDDGDCVGVWFFAFHSIEQPIQDFVEFTTIRLRPCSGYC